MKISHGYNAIEFGAASLSLKSSGCVVLAYRRHGFQAFSFFYGMVDIIFTKRS